VRDVAGAVVLAAQRRMLPGTELENVLLGSVTIELVDAQITEVVAVQQRDSDCGKKGLAAVPSTGEPLACTPTS
jgi:hypothetical protein